MAQDFCTAFLELTSSETSCIFDRMFEVLLKESAEVKEFLKLHKLASDELEVSEILPLVRAYEGTIVVPESIEDMWKWSPVKALEYVKHEFETVGYPLATLKMYLKSNTKEIYEAGKTDKTSDCFATVLNKSGCEVLYQKQEVEQAELIDALKNVEVKNWCEVISEKFLELHKSKGLEDDDFVEAVKFVNTLNYAWPRLVSITGTVKDSSEPTSEVESSKLAEIYSGNYRLVPETEPQSEEICTELVTDEVAFEQLSEDEKKRVSHFLCSNFKKFTNYLIKFITKIFDAFNLIDNEEFKKELATVNNNGSIYEKNDAIMKAFEDIQKAMSNFAVKDLETGMNAILYGYLPILRKFKKSENFNSKLGNNMMYCKNLRLLGAAGKISEPVRTYADVSRRPAQIASFVGGDKINGGSERFSSKEEDYKIYKPNSSTGKYLKALRELQISYNTKFVEIYREIIDKLEAIQQEEISKLDNIKAATIIGQFEKILISSNRTTVYLSGILPTKNYSKQFIDAANNLAKLCKTIGGCFEQLEQSVSKFVKLGRETTTAYQKIRSEYLESSKDASEMLINSENIDAFKVKCDLKKTDFIRKIDACKRIITMCNNRAGVKMGSSTADMLKKYISGMTDRDKMIAEYFDSYTSGIKYILSQTHRTEDLAIIKPLISMKMILVDETKKAYLWLNQYLDKFLIDKRIEQLGKASLDKKTVEKIANAFVEFKKYSKIGLDELVRKYKSFLSSENLANISVNSYFKLFKLAKQTFEEVDAFTYLEKLYNELGITEPSFNWPTFKSKLIGYLINGMIWFDIYEYHEGSTEFTLMKNIKEDFGVHLDKHVNPSNIFSIEDSTIPVEIRKYAANIRLEDEDLKYRMKKIAEILNMNCDIYTKMVAGKYDKHNMWERNNELYLDENWCNFIKDSTHILNALKKIDDTVTVDNFVDKCKENKELARVAINTYYNDTNKEIYDGIIRKPMKEESIDEVAEYSVGDGFDDNFTNQNKYLYHYTNFGYALKKICMTNGNYKVAGAIIGFSMRHLGKVVSLFEGFENYVIESMYTPVIQIIDKYIIQRYQGNRDFSTNTHDLLQGGDEDLKREAGSVFDIVEPHEPVESEIITQAVPFYISAYVILNYYISHYANKEDADMQLKLSISSISPLSDFKEKFEKEDKFKLADEQELKQYVSIMNEYWNSTVGNTDKEKVINAVDHIISELNSMLIFGNDEKVIRLQESGIDESHLDIYTINFKNIHETLVKTITEATNNLVRKGVNNNAAVEAYFGKKVTEVKEATPSQRIGILKQILYDVDDDTKQDANNEYTSFIDLCVSPMYIINEIYKHVVDMTKFTFEQQYDISETKNIAAAQLNQTREFNSLALAYYEKGYKTVGEIITHLFDEYYKDFDQTLHNIMNFPGLSDGQIKSFLDNVHNTFKTITETASSNIKATKSFKVMENVEYVKDKILIPDVEPQAKLMQDIYIDETVFSPDTLVFANKETKSFTQFVISVISSLNPSCFVPQIFSDLMKSSSLVNNTFEVMAKPKYEKKKDTFDPYIGKCLSTYIMCLSTTQTATSSMASNQMTQTVANKYISTIPMLLAILTKCASVLDTNATYKVLIDKKNDYANYQNINARTEIGILIDILSKTYNDILPFSGEIQFMNGSTTTFSHYLSEIRHQLSTTGLNFKTFIQQPEKYEWIFERACPELKIRYKSYDRFTDYKTKFSVMLCDITFAKQFEVLLNILAKNIFRSFFLSVTYDPEEDGGNSFNGRLLGGDMCTNINTLLNALGMPCLKDCEHSVVAKIFNILNITKDNLTTDTLSVLFNNTEFISMLNSIRDKIHVTSDIDSAYVAFVNNTLEGNYPKKDTVSAPLGIIKAATLVKTYEVAKLIKYTCNIKNIQFYFYNGAETDVAIEKAFKDASYTAAETYSLIETTKGLTGTTKGLTDIKAPQSNLLNNLVHTYANKYYYTLTDGKSEEQKIDALDFEHAEFNKGLILPISVNDETYKNLYDMFKSQTNNPSIDLAKPFIIQSPFDFAAEWCKVSPKYKEAFEKFDFSAIIKAWSLIVFDTGNFCFGLTDTKLFDNLISSSFDKTNDDLKEPKPIVFDVNEPGYEHCKAIPFKSLLEFILNIGYVDGENVKFPVYNNYPECKGFWNLFAVPQKRYDAPYSEFLFNFNILSTDDLQTQVRIREIQPYVEQIISILPDGNDYKEMMASVNYKDSAINIALNNTLLYKSNNHYKLVENDKINNKEILKFTLEWLRTSREDRNYGQELLRRYCKQSNKPEFNIICRTLLKDYPARGKDSSNIFADNRNVWDVNSIPSLIYSSVKRDIDMLKINNYNVPAIIPIPSNYEWNGSTDMCMTDGDAILAKIVEDGRDTKETNNHKSLTQCPDEEDIERYGVKLGKDERTEITFYKYISKIMKLEGNTNIVHYGDKRDIAKELYIDLLYKMINEGYINEEGKCYRIPEHMWFKSIDAFIYDVCYCYKQVLKAVYNAIEYDEVIVSAVKSFDTSAADIFNSLLAVKKYYIKLRANGNMLSVEDNQVLLGMLLVVYTKYLEYKDNKNTDFMFGNLINEVGEVIKRIKNNFSDNKLSPFVELSSNFILQPMSVSKIALESLGLIRRESLILDPNTKLIGENTQGAIADAIDKTIRDMEDNFAKLSVDSLMVQNMTGGDLEDVDSSVLLNMYAKTDDKFRKFLSNSDVKLDTMIIAYFGKPLLSFNTYFNKNIFVEIVYNSALFKTSLQKIHGSVSEAGDNKYWARLINNVFENEAFKNPEKESGVWDSRRDLARVEFNDDEKSVFGAITQPSINRKFFDYKINKHNEEDIPLAMYDFLNKIQGDGLTKLLLKIDACNEAVGTLAQWIKNFTFTNVEYNDEETFTKYDYDHEPFSY